MTHREASTIALRELGFTEKWIEVHHAAADANMVKEYGPAALSEVNSQLILPPGLTIQGYIKQLKRMASAALLQQFLDPKGFEKTKAIAKAKLDKTIRGN